MNTEKKGKQTNPTLQTNKQKPQPQKTTPYLFPPQKKNPVKCAFLSLWQLTAKFFCFYALFLQWKPLASKIALRLVTFSFICQGILELNYWLPGCQSRWHLCPKVFCDEVIFVGIYISILIKGINWKYSSLYWKKMLVVEYVTGSWWQCLHKIGSVEKIIIFFCQDKNIFHSRCCTTFHWHDWST